ncbi:MAG: RNA-binding S4 domain-containing protein [Firmicutes bacterium]|jgi:ribosome-associated protein|nr:RNA-binding S4 domain-containing protein [Bacillota bacterium]NLO66113.1 RNA-binding S4 domain-containing protein [Bacillota bacterium]
MEEIKIRTESIQLDQLLKWAGAAATGGEAKYLIQNGQVSVNGNVELRRSTRVQPGDVVEIAGQGKFVVGREA